MMHDIGNRTAAALLLTWSLGALACHSEPRSTTTPAQSHPTATATPADEATPLNGGGSLVDAHPDEFARAFSNHLICNQILVQAFVGGMKRQKYGRIINVISTSVKAPIRGLGVSNTIRGAVANWAKTLSIELGPFGITVNNLLPGAIMTARLQDLARNRAQESGKQESEIMEEMIQLIPAGRIGEPGEIAAAAAFLASPAAAYINGINLPVDGGRTPAL